MPSKIAVPYDDALTESCQPYGDGPHPSVILKIDGLHARHDGPEPLFELVLDKAPAQIDYSEIYEVLKKQGVASDVAEPAVEKMARFIEVQSLALILAERIKVQP